MRLTTSHSESVRTSRAAVPAVCSRRGLRVALLLAVFLSSVISSAKAAPATGAAKEGPRRGTTTAAASPTRRGKPELAVVYDDTYRAPAKDLLLALDGERKAEAAARFVSGLLQEEGSPEAANDQYLKSLALDPGNAELSVKLAQDYVRKGDVPAAINLLKDTIKAAPKQPKPYLALAYVYYNQQNKADLAQKYIQDALELDPAQIRGYDYLRTIYKDTNQNDKIPALLDRAAKVNAEDASYWLYLGKLFIEQYLSNDTNLAPGEPLQKTTAVFQKAFEHGKNEPDIIGKVADFFVATKQYKEAIPVYQRVVELDPTELSARENLARCYIATEQTDQAAEALKGLIKANPADQHAYDALAKIYQKNEQYDKAVANYEQSLLINPDSFETYQTIAFLRARQNQAAKAIPLLLEAHKRYPNQPGYAYLLAITQAAAKQHKESLASYEEAETLGLRVLPAMLDADFYFSYGVSAEQTGLYDRAAILLKKALSTETDSRREAVYSNYLGYMWVDHDMNLEEGGDLIKRALEIDPDNGAYLDSLGWYYYRTNQFEQAIAELSKAAAATQPEDPAVYEHLGDAYAKLNNTGKAIEAWEKAVALDGNNPELPNLNKKISEAKAAVPAAGTPKS